jgi:hypothetical protein
MIGVTVPIVSVGAVGFVWYFFSPQYTDVGYMPKQPIPFSHKLHAGDLGVDCRYCHTTVETSKFATIPSTEMCMNCHTIVKNDSPKLAPLRDSMASGKPVQWVNVHMLPDYAHFDHSAHVSTGVSCVSCHGRIDQMPEVKQVEPLSMSWCLDCHRNPEPHLRPPHEVTNLAWDKQKAKYNPNEDPERTRKVNPPVHCSACHY